MNFKALGFIAGAAVAGAAVFAFNTWRHVSDDDLLTAVLRDHCLPYVTDGTLPFETIGRSPGVYDTVHLRDGIQEGQVALLFDARFVGEWGIVTHAGRNSRVCMVQPTYDAGTIAAFEVAPDGFVGRYTQVLATAGDVEPDMNDVAVGPASLGWFSNPTQRDRGLRAVMIVSPGLVSDVVVLNEIAD